MIAGLGDFQPPTGSTGAAGGTGGAGGAGGAGGDGSVTGASSSKSSGSSGPGPSSSTSSGGACANHLLINEVRVQNGDFVELYNPTNAPIPLFGLTLWARTSGSSLGQKWVGPAGPAVPAKSFFLLGASGVPNADDTLSTGIVSDDPTVVVLKDGSNQVVDSLCVCTASAPCSFVDGAADYCAGRALISASFHVTNDPDSAQRTSCADTNVDSADFATGCPTPRAPNFTVATCP